MYLIIFFLFSLCSNSPIANYSIIPLPKEIIEIEGSPFLLSNLTQITYSPSSSLQKNNSEYLSNCIFEKTKIKVKINPNLSLDTSNIIYLQINETINMSEQYIIIINENNITIQSKTPNGIFYGIQTIFKSLPITIKNPEIKEISFPQIYINDYPLFSYRGMMLDSSRHYYSIDFIKKFLNLLSLHNMNKFHWHLSDDQGWRIEIKKYPLLTKKSSFRSKTVINKNSGYYDDIPYGGFYTQDEAREVVEYARMLYIDVIPEVDLPGHTLAALSAYPYLGCTGGPYEVQSTWGVFDDIMCAGKEETFEFIEDIYNELINIFPSEFFHIGGDEAPKTRWKICDKCQERMKNENITSEEKLQGYFSRRVEKILNNKGKNVIGWDEILNGDVSLNTIIMNWRGVSEGQKAVKLGYKVIMSPVKYLYFDYSQNNDFYFKEPFTIGGYVGTDVVYSFNPFDELSESEQKQILGVQANLWSEYIFCDNMAFYQILPRISALSEVQWRNFNDRNFSEFLGRIKGIENIYDLYGFIYENNKFRE